MWTNEDKTYGYARVSTREQNEDRQLLAMRECGIEERDIFIDRQSGKDFNRPEYRRLMKTLKPYDTLYVKSIDRLGRNYDEIMNQWRIITKEMQVYIVVIDMPLLDTRQKDRDLTGIFISDLVLQILSYVAETEREFIHQRQAEGIAAAKAKGVRLGRPPQERTEAFSGLCEDWLHGRTTARRAALQLNISHRTFSRWARECMRESLGL